MEAESSPRHRQHICSWCRDLGLSNSPLRDHSYRQHPCLLQSSQSSRRRVFSQASKCLLACPAHFEEYLCHETKSHPSIHLSPRIIFWSVSRYVQLVRNRCLQDNSVSKMTLAWTSRALVNVWWAVWVKYFEKVSKRIPTFSRPDTVTHLKLGFGSCFAESISSIATFVTLVNIIALPATFELNDYSISFVEIDIAVKVDNGLWIMMFNLSFISVIRTVTTTISRYSLYYIQRWGTSLTVRRLWHFMLINYNTQLWAIVTKTVKLNSLQNWKVLAKNCANKKWCQLHLKKALTLRSKLSFILMSYGIFRTRFPCQWLITFVTTWTKSYLRAMKRLSNSLLTHLCTET